MHDVGLFCVINSKEGQGLHAHNANKHFLLYKFSVLISCSNLVVTSIDMVPSATTLSEK